MAVYASEAFHKALKSSHLVISRIEAQRGETKFNVDFEQGNLVQSYDDASRWSLDLSFPMPSSYTPASIKSLLNQRLTTLRPARGVQFPDGTQEVINFAKFYVANVEVDEAVGGAPIVQVQAYDRSIRAQGDISAPFYIPSNSYASQILPQLIGRKVPGVTYFLAQSQFPMPALLVTQDMDAWDESLRMMSGQGQNLYFDREDRCVSSIRALTPSPTHVVWHYDENNSPDFWGVKRSGTNDLFPNVVNVIGTNPAAPGIAGQAADMDPSSPTYRFGDYGEVVRTFRSEQITSQLQANTMAAYLLSKLLGPQDEVTFQAIPNPILDAGDTILLTRVSMGFSATPLLVVRIEMPLGIEGAMTLTCRRSILTNTSGAPVRP